MNNNTEIKRMDSKFHNNKTVRKLIKEVNFFDFLGMFFVNGTHVMIDHNISNSQFRKKFEKRKNKKGMTLFEEFMGLNYEDGNTFKINSDINSDTLTVRLMTIHCFINNNSLFY
jgi:hypothetical protein